MTLEFCLPFDLDVRRKFDYLVNTYYDNSLRYIAHKHSTLFPESVTRFSYDAES